MKLFNAEKMLLFFDKYSIYTQSIFDQCFKRIMANYMCILFQNQLLLELSVYPFNTKQVC